MTDPNVPAKRVPGSPVDQRVKEDLYSGLAEVRGVLARDFSDEIYAQRHAAVTKGLDVVFAGLDALYGAAGHAEETLSKLGAKAAAETRGEIVPDDNVITVPEGSFKSSNLPDLPDQREHVLYPPTAPLNPLGDAAPDNMTTDPRVNPNLDDPDGLRDRPTGKDA